MQTAKQGGPPWESSLFRCFDDLCCRLIWQPGQQRQQPERQPWRKVLHKLWLCGGAESYSPQQKFVRDALQSWRQKKYSDWFPSVLTTLVRYTLLD